MLRYLIVLAVLAPSWVIAQGKKAKPGFESTIGAGALLGDSESSYQLQWVNGLKMNNWFTGIGIALDNYRIRSVPVFISARRDNLFGNSVFGYADAGISFPADTKKITDDGFFAEEIKFSKGFYGEAGVGYRPRTKGRFSVQFSVGYSLRTVNENVIAPMSWSSSWPQPTVEYTNHHTFHLLTLRTSVSLNPRK